MEKEKEKEIEWYI